ncbi:MAG: sugar ABC transporter permease [Gammaproteobacteria bacterium]|nr:sugar ABC transporter permease [Gammaproteobacteria bacterium]
MSGALRRIGERPAAFLAPAALVLGVVTLFPIVYVLWLSVQHYSLIGDAPAFAGVGNFARLFADARFWNALGNTVYFTLVSVALEVVIGLAFALLLARPFVGRAPMRAVVLLPWAIPTVVAARMWEWMYNGDFGVINYLAGADTNWLGNPYWAIHAAIAMDVWKATPFVALLLLAGRLSIPAELYQAARLDGAGAWRLFRHITWPLLRPLLLIVLIFRTIDAFRVFDAIYVLTGGGPANTTETLSIYAYKVLFQTLEFGYGSALAVAVFVCIAAITAAYVWLLRGSAR